MFHIYAPLILILAMFVIFIIVAMVRYGERFCSLHRDFDNHDNYTDERLEQVSYA